MYANVVVEYPVKSLDKSFVYSIPSSMVDKLKIGMKVLVPFGKKIINGIVIDIIKHKPEYETKSIYSIENEEIVLTDEQLKLGVFIKEETLCTLISAYQSMLPSALKIKKQSHKYDLYDTYIKLNNDQVADEYIKRYPKRIKQIEIIELLKEGEKNAKDFPSLLVKQLYENDLIVKEKRIKYRINNFKFDGKEHKLNDEQLNAYNIIHNNLNKEKTYLIQGVTGCGKTEVYMHLINDVIKKGRQAIVLVPEISLTTQTVNRFYNRFGDNVAIFHSGLSIGEKYDEYLKIVRKEVQIVVGTRSSIFVPFDNIGLIVIDEEHSDTYKQNTNPQYNAIEIAKFRSKYHKCPLILGSATPSLESRARADKNVYELIKINKRVNNVVLPKITLVDMTEEVKKRNFLFSDMLKQGIKNALDKKEQIMIFLNRRGFSTFISCNNCGCAFKCPNCDITLTYHKTSNNLRCHYCGYVEQKLDICPSCHNKSLTFLGTGTQKLEEELNKLYPDASIIRMDQDTTTKKGSYQKIIDDFENHKYDILVGTQMISKGLDFKNVTLMGIINADYSLNIPDFRSNENTFSLLNQASGRAGRDKKNGEVIIQTYNTDNDVIQYVKNNDYDAFYKYEMNIRHKLKYPPYTYICIVGLKGKDYNLLSKEINNIHKYLSNKLDEKTILYKPTTAPIFKINNIYHFQILIKYTYDNKIKSTLMELDNIYATNNAVNLVISFNPSRF